jgi:phage shock protein A
VIARQLTASRQARAELTAGEQYRDLADEYRRLSDVAITAQEHLDLRLTDLSVRIDELRDKVEQMQHILKEVE